MPDGAGFDPELPGRDGSPMAETGGFGLVSMRERARELGGSLRLESFPGEGTVVNVELPLGPGAGLPGMRGGGR